MCCSVTGIFHQGSSKDTNPLKTQYPKYDCKDSTTSYHRLERNLITEADMNKLVTFVLQVDDINL